MSESDWRSPEPYAIMQDAEAADFAWEFVRRNPDYRRDHRKLQRNGSRLGVNRTFRHRWGFLFAADPHRNFKMQTIFWSPEVLPTVLRAAAVSWATLSRPCHLDLSQLSSADIRQAYDGWHAVLRLGGVTHRLWLQELPPTGAPIVLELLLDADFGLQSHAAHRLWLALEKAARRAPDPALPKQRRQRFILAMRALDGRIEGNSYRAIAENLFGKVRIPQLGWKAHDLRSRTIRLVQTGVSLMRGDYLGLLRRKRTLR
jgi:hypothetical protein